MDASILVHLSVALIAFAVGLRVGHFRGTRDTIVLIEPKQ